MKIKMISPKKKVLKERLIINLFIQNKKIYSMWMQMKTKKMKIMKMKIQKKKKTKNKILKYQE